jgi:hypothetical protein
VTYFTPFNSRLVFKYELDKDNWTELPLCPQANFGLSVIEGFPTAIGGVEADKQSSETTHTNTLVSFDGTQWVKKFPPMITPRSRPAVATSSDGTSLVAAGGLDDDGDWWSIAVEHYDSSTQTWTSLAGIPMRLPGITAVLCGDQLFLLEWGDSVYTCSLQALLAQAQSPHSASPTATQSLWKAIVAPVPWSTPVNMCGKLVVVGGHTRPNPTNAIHLYDKGEWMCIGHTFYSRRDSIVASPRDDIIVVVGGLDPQVTDDVEILSVSS